MKKIEILNSVMERRKESVDVWNEMASGKITSEMTTKELMALLEMHNIMITKLWSAIESLFKDELDYKNPNRL